MATLLMEPRKTYYDILGIKRNASEYEIRQAYKDLAIKYHPDKNINEQREIALERFKELNQAYNILQDEGKRMVYDIYERNQKTIQSFPQLNQNYQNIKQLFHHQENDINYDFESSKLRQQQFKEQTENTENLLNFNIQQMKEKIGDSKVSQISQFSKMIVKFIDHQTEADYDSSEQQYQQSQQQKFNQNKNSFQQGEGLGQQFYEDFNRLSREYTNNFCNNQQKWSNNINELNSKNTDFTDLLLKQVQQLNSQYKQNSQNRKYKSEFIQTTQFVSNNKNLSESEGLTLTELIEKSYQKLQVTPQKVPYLITKKTISKQQQRETGDKIVQKIRERKLIFQINQN